MIESTRDPNISLKSAEIIRMFRIAVRRAQEESRRLGVPNVYSLNGRIYYELPNGDYVRDLPEQYKLPPLPSEPASAANITSTPEA